MTTTRPLPLDLENIAITQLNERPEQLEEDLRALKLWIKQQPHLRARDDDQFLVAFLRGCKFSLNKAKSKIDMYYTLKTKYPNFYTIQDVNDERVLEIIRYGVGLHLPIPLNENGPRIMLIRPGIYPAEKFSFENIMCIAHAMESITLMEDDYANVNGYIDILDLSNYSAAHMFQLTPAVMKKMSIFAEEAMPLRQKATHFINAPSGFEKLFNVLKPIMPMKQQERLFVHNSKLSALYDYIPQKYLPEEYGGSNGSINDLIASAERKFKSYKDFFLEELTFGTDEKLRPGKKIDFENIFGVDGTFRKLNVD